MERKELQELLDLLKTFDIILVPCGSAKNPNLAEGTPEEIYVGAFFKKQLALAKKLNKPIYVISSKYGVVSLDQLIKPYNLVWDIRTARDAGQRGKPRPPYLLEHQRVAISEQVTTLFKGKRVLSLCSKFYKKHQPEFIYFHDLIAPFASHSIGMGMPFITKILHLLITEVE